MKTSVKTNRTTVTKIKKTISKFQPLIEQFGWSMTRKMLAEIKKILASDGETIEGFLASRGIELYKANRPNYRQDLVGKLKPRDQWLEPLFSAIW